jgi:hypothetical protein
MGQSLLILLVVLLATWYFFGGSKNPTLKERDMLDAAFNGKAAASGGDLGDSGRDFVAAMQQAVSSFVLSSPSYTFPGRPRSLYQAAEPSARVG